MGCLNQVDIKVLNLAAIFRKLRITIAEQQSTGLTGIIHGKSLGVRNVGIIRYKHIEM